MGADQWKFVTAIVVALLSGGLAYWRARRDTTDRIRLLEAERELSERERLEAQLHKYRGIIMLSAADLQDRLWHLTGRQARSDKPVLLNEDPDAPAYAAWPMTRRHYLTGTVYLFARYWCWIEVLNRTIRYLDFGDDDRTLAFRNRVKLAERTLAETGLQKASDTRIRADQPIFQMQQALIGQSLIRGEADNPECMDFAAFSTKYETLREEFPEYKALEELLCGAMKPARSAFHLKRLGLFANALVGLMDFLDPDHRLVPAAERERLPVAGVKPDVIEKQLGAVP